jgi:hypothetical protein
LFFKEINSAPKEFIVAVSSELDRMIFNCNYF